MSGAMRKFLIVAEITISISTEVEAETIDKAIAIADARPLMSFCHQCARGEPEREWCTSGELDGEPEVLRDESFELEAGE